YDHTDHHRFDVCADDHCQRYQGIARQTTDTVRKAVRDTRGEVLVCQGRLVDARFSKCCGGVFEQFENCWEPVEHPYLQARRDAPCATDFPDLTDEKNARQWILSRPDAFCAAPSGEVLSQVLNGYDMETPDFYRWRVEYDRHTLASIVRGRTGIDFGDIIDLQPLERGTSGRIVMLRIVGTRHTMEIGKELEIRRSLSDSHLYSSAFVVERADIDSDGVPARIILHGAGWGHGVGLCQIGAAVMGDSGYDYKTILGRYFIGAGVDKLY
ncbi:MAG: amidase, partial [Muribaculaceae bacterium]|nr:amidase [Muribaculaceae bacterium]